MQAGAPWQRDIGLGWQIRSAPERQKAQSMTKGEKARTGYPSLLGCRREIQGWRPPMARRQNIYSQSFRKVLEHVLKTNEPQILADAFEEILISGDPTDLLHQEVRRAFGKLSKPSPNPEEVREIGER